MPGQVDLAVAADDAAVALDQDRGIVMPRLAPFLGQLGVAEVKPDVELTREIKQRSGLGTWHFTLEKAVDLGLIGHPIAREEGRQRQLGEDDELRTPRMSLTHQSDQPADDRAAGVGEMDRAELGDRRFQLTRHNMPPSDE